MMGFVLKMMNFILKMMIVAGTRRARRLSVKFVMEMMNFAFKMMDFAFKMMM